jgi:hypothetical protein
VKLTEPFHLNNVVEALDIAGVCRVKTVMRSLELDEDPVNERTWTVTTCLLVWLLLMRLRLMSCPDHLFLNAMLKMVRFNLDNATRAPDIVGVWTPKVERCLALFDRPFKFL